MFGVLVVILCPDRVTDLGFRAGERQTPFIVVTRFGRLFGSGRAAPDVHRFERAANDVAGLSGRALMIVFGSFLHSSLLGGCRQMRRGNDHNFCRLIGSVVVAEPAVLHTK